MTERASIFREMIRLGDLYVIGEGGGGPVRTVVDFDITDPAGELILYYDDLTSENFGNVDFEDYIQALLDEIAAAQSPNYRPTVAPGAALDVVADLGRFPVAAGASAEQAPATLLLRQTAGASLSPSPTELTVAISPAVGLAPAPATLLVAQASGADIEIAPATLLVKQTPGAELDIVAAGTIKHTQAAGSAISPVVSVTPFPQAAAGEIVQIKYDLTKNIAAVTSVNTRIASSIDWVNTANGTGMHNAGFSTLTATAIAAANARLDFTYAATVNKTPLTITSVKIKFYYKLTLGTLQTVSSVLSWSIGAGAQTTLATDTAAVDHSASGREFDITSGIAGSWSNIDALKARIATSYNANATPGVASLDAVEVTILATLTETI